MPPELSDPAPSVHVRQHLGDFVVSNQETAPVGQIAVGPVQIADRTVLAEYSPTER